MYVFNVEEILKPQINLLASQGKKPKPVEPSVKVAMQYNSRLQMMVRGIKKDIDEIIMPVVKKYGISYTFDTSIFTQDANAEEIVASMRRVMNKWSSPQLREVAKQVAAFFVSEADFETRKKFNASMKSFGMDVYGDSPLLQEFIEDAIIENTELITTIPEQYLSRVQTIILSSVRQGLRSSYIEKELQKQFNVTKNRARFIARDQTAKINGDYIAKRQQGAGFKYFQWETLRDNKVRERHRNISNKLTKYGKGVYRWDDLPLSQNGIPIKPGDDFQCRCVAVPVAEWEVEQNQDEGLTNKRVKR